MHIIACVQAGHSVTCPPKGLAGGCLLFDHEPPVGAGILVIINWPSFTFYIRHTCFLAYILFLLKPVPPKIYETNYVYHLNKGGGVMYVKFFLPFSYHL